MLIYQRVKWGTPSIPCFHRKRLLAWSFSKVSMVLGSPILGENTEGIVSISFAAFFQQVYDYKGVYQAI